MWLNTVWPIHTMEYHLASERKDIRTHTMWMTLDDMMVGEINQAQKDKCCMCPLPGGTESSQVHRHGKQRGGCQGPKGGDYQELSLIGYRVQFREMKRFWRQMVVMFVQCTECV